MIHSNVRYLPGLLLLVVLAVHSAVDHQTTWSKVRQVGYPWKGLSKNILVLQSSCLWVRWGGKEPNLQNLPLAAFYHFGASWKAVVARSVTLEQRQIEGWSWWQNWPILCALQLCCWVEDLKTNISGWWEFQPVTIPPLAETKLRSCSGRSQQNEPWNLLCISRLVESVIFIYANPQTFSKISFSQSLAETSIEEKYGP